MTRTEDDSWDITEGVGATALGVAWARAQESASQCPLFTDHYAQLFVDAAKKRGWRLPPKYMLDRIRSISGYTASRTKWFDEFFIAAGACGITQAVILAAGLDARGWRLPWLDGTVLYEIDQPKVMDFKTRTLIAHDAKPNVAQYVSVPTDLRQDWPKALRQAGFDPTQPTAWAAEGLLAYLPAADQDLLFERVHQNSARDSRIGVESFGAGFFDGADFEDLRLVEERTDVADWLSEHGWEITSFEASELMTRYGRGQPDAASPRTVFVEGLRS